MTIMNQQTFSPEQIEQMIQREYAVLASPFSSQVQVAVASAKMAQLVAMRSSEKVAAMELAMGLRGEAVS